MAKTFKQMVSDAKAEVGKTMSAQELQQALQGGQKPLVIDVRQSEEVTANGAIPGSLNIPLGVLPIKADNELPESFREARLADRDQPIVTTCAAGGQASLAAKTLKDMGFTNVTILEGGTKAWKDAGLPTQ